MPAKDIKFSGPIVAHILNKERQEKAKEVKEALSKKINKLINGGDK